MAPVILAASFLLSSLVAKSNQIRGLEKDKLDDG